MAQGAVRTVVDGDRSTGWRPNGPSITSVTEQDKVIIRLVAEGVPHPEIARRLKISRSNVERTIYRKIFYHLRVESTRAMVLEAVRLGLVTLSGPINLRAPGRRAGHAVSG